MNENTDQVDILDATYKTVMRRSQFTWQTLRTNSLVNGEQLG